jgi:hypothetical protein
MQRSAFACLAALLATAASHAGPAEDAIVAAMKLPDAANYSWSTNVDDDARSYAIDGQTDRANDYSLVTMPLVAAARRNAGTGTANSANLSTFVFKGDEKSVVQVDSSWKTIDELTASPAAVSNSGYRSGLPSMGGWGGMRGRGRRGMMGGFGGMGPGSWPSNTVNGESAGANGRQPPPYSNLQKTLSRPHEELGIIVAGANDLKIEGDIVSGTLSDTAAKLLLVHPGQKEITPLKANGTFRLWLKDGALVKYAVKLDGTLAVLSNGNRREVEVHQTALTEIKNVGTTKFDVPADAKKILGG